MNRRREYVIYPEGVSGDAPMTGSDRAATIGAVATSVPMPRTFLARAWSGVLAVWAAFIGLLPHILHHVGPLAGAALLAGAGGRALFAAIGFLFAIPFLLRLHRRFRTWLAPGIALGLMAAAFALSSFVIGPLIAGDGDAPAPGIEEPAGPGTEEPDGHEEHH